MRRSSNNKYEQYQILNRTHKIITKRSKTLHQNLLWVLHCYNSKKWMLLCEFWCFTYRYEVSAELRNRQKLRYQFWFCGKPLFRLSILDSNVSEQNTKNIESARMCSKLVKEKELCSKSGFSLDWFKCANLIVDGSWSSCSCFFCIK